MNELQIFKNTEFGEIRTTQTNNEPWFVAKDVCDVFGETNRNRAMQSLDEDEKGYTQMNTPGGSQQVSIVNESGLYTLLFAMQPTKARGVSDEHIANRVQDLKNFKRWITREVIPTIRKHGAYMTPETLEAVILNPDSMIKILTVLKEEQDKRKALETENALKIQIIGELQPKANYVDDILNNKGLVTITQIAKDYGMSGRKFNQLLASKDVQYKQSGQWLLYSKYHDKGYTHSETVDITRSDGRKDIKMRTKFTQKGRLFIYELLKADNIMPVIEQIKV